ncbi:Cytosolic sulfotransferase 6 [Morella rubra]|uniref:Sulfotransferase n=1 Tax=Morella rubra TaxID=262757 RepID=A0A6A1VQQ3_9ROSI|nr:Cytosolic sulfotransferase 6 [Morella rubra]
MATHQPPPSPASKNLQEDNELTQKSGMNPKDTFVSVALSKQVYGPFWDHVLSYWKESLEKPQKGIFFLKYEEMKEQPTIHLKQLAEFLGCSFSPEEEAKGIVNDIINLCSFNNLSNLEVNKKESKNVNNLGVNEKGSTLQFSIENASFFRRGKVGDWKNYLTAQMAEKCDRITEERFHSVGLIF